MIIKYMWKQAYDIRHIDTREANIKIKSYI